MMVGDESVAQEAMATANAGASVVEVTAEDAEPVRLSALDPAGVDTEQGPRGEWIKALRVLRAAERDMDEWVKTAGALAKACRQWLDINREWAKEIAVRFNQEPNSVTMYVVLRNPGTVTLDQRRFVAGLGLLLGAAFQIYARAAAVSTRPADHGFIVD